MSLANHQNHAQADDGTFVVCPISEGAGNTYSAGLLATGLRDVLTGLPLDLPGDGNYLGFEVTVIRKAVNVGEATVNDQTVALAINGAQVVTSMNLADPDPWPTSETAIVYGNSLECWNVLGVEGGLVFADVGDPTFGLFLQCGLAVGGEVTAMIEQITMALTYYVDRPRGGGPYHRSRGGYTGCGYDRAPR